MAKDQSKHKDTGQEELKELLESDTPATEPKTEPKKRAEPAPKLADDAPPDPRAAGTTPAKKTDDTEDEVVDEIAAENAHTALDDMYEHDREPETPLVVVGDEKKHWYNFLKRPKFWVTFIGLLLAGAVIAWLITPSRVWFLNTIGLRTQFSLTALVSTPQGPPPMLKNALVTINGHEYRTNDEGNLQVAIPYGQTRIVITKPGYETVTKDQLFDFDPFFYYLGGKQFDEQQRTQSVLMKVVGLEVKFTAKDWLTGSPLTTGHFSVGDVVTTPSAQGEVSLLIPATDDKTVELAAKFGGSGYADTTQQITLAEQPAEINFVPAGKHYFVSKRSGQFAVYSSNIDGSAVAEVVPGSARETGDIAFSVSPSGKYAVLASTREGTRDTFGTVQQKLYVVDLSNNKLTELETALQFDIADWSGDTVVYTAKFREGSASKWRVASADVVKRQAMTQDRDASLKVVRVRLGSVIYLRADNELKTFKVGTGGEKSLGTGVQKFTQPEADKFAYQIADKSWRQYDVNADQVTTITTPNALNRAFLASTSGDGQTALTVEAIDGKPTLIAKAVGNGQEKQLYAGADLRGPIRWIGNVVVYRAGETDYAVGATGGTPKKITDVTATHTSQNDYFDFN